MTIFAVEGAAGTGKTTRLMAALEEAIKETPLKSGQRVLALTFMHGARRRLNDRVRKVPNVRSRCECATIDSVAQRIIKRWRTLLSARGITIPNEGQYDAQCNVAGILLEQPEVRSWMRTSFPVVVVDEAQDLKPERLRIIRALARAGTTLIAADEFQCLDATLRPNPATKWLHKACRPEVLTQVRRTNINALLAAATAIRSGNAPVAAGNLRIFPSQGVPMAAVYLANAIAWRGTGQVAVITPALQGDFARNVVRRVQQQPCGKHQNGPYNIRWENSEADEVAAINSELVIADTASISDTLSALEKLGQSSIARGVRSWAQLEVNATKRTEFTRTEIEAQIARHVHIRRQHYGMESEFVALTIQQAKNREFEGVVILWPYQVGGDTEHKRRLLYNALTRAKRWCTIVTQSPQILKSAPFA